MKQRTLKQHHGLASERTHLNLESFPLMSCTPGIELLPRPLCCLAHGLLGNPKIAPLKWHHLHKHAELIFLYSTGHFSIHRVLCPGLIQFTRIFTTNMFMYIPHFNASYSSRVARPCPVVPQSSSPVSPRCLLVVARSGRTQSPLWTRYLSRSANRPMVKGRFLLLLPLIFHQTKVKVI